MNEAAVPLKATFEYGALAGLGSIDSQTPIKVRWYWSDENANLSRSNGFGESTVPYDRIITYTTTLTPATDTVGIKYYYAVLSYAESVIISSGHSEAVLKEAVTAPARIEVIDDKTPGLIEDDHFAYMQGYPNGRSGRIKA